jgi:putative aldouronate transport system substrate-binding protein
VKRRVLSMMLVLALLIFAPACSAIKNTEAPTPTPTTAPIITLKMCAINWGDYSLNRKGGQKQNDILAEKIGVRIDYIDIMKPADAAAELNVLVAANEHMDLIHTGGDMTNYRKLVDEGYLQDLKPAMDAGKLPNVISNYNPGSWKIVGYKSGIFAIPYENPANVYNFLIRKDLLDKYGLSVPTTVDGLTETVASIVKSENNNYGLIQPWIALGDLFAGSYIATGNMNWKDTDGSIKPWYLNVGYKDYLAAMNKMYKSGALPKDYLTKTYAEWEESMTAGSYVATFLWSAGNTELMLNGYTKKNVPNAEFVPISELKGTIDGAYPASNATASDLFLVTKECVDLEAAYRYIDFVNSSEGFYLANRGIEEVHYKVKEVLDGNYTVFDPDFQSGLDGEDKFVYFRFGVPVKLGFSSGPAYNKPFFDHLDTMRLFRGDDFGLIYDTNLYDSKDIMTDLQDLIDAESTKIILGQANLDGWDAVIQKWFDLGGQTYIDDMTKQYNASK